MIAFVSAGTPVSTKICFPSSSINVIDVDHWYSSFSILTIFPPVSTVTVGGEGKAPPKGLRGISVVGGWVVVVGVVVVVVVVVEVLVDVWGSSVAVVVSPPRPQGDHGDQVDQVVGCQRVHSVGGGVQGCHGRWVVGSGSQRVGGSVQVVQLETDGKGSGLLVAEKNSKIFFNFYFWKILFIDLG